MRKPDFAKIDLTLNSSRMTRKEWEKAFKEMADNEEDRLLFDDVFQDENLEEWK